MVQTRARTPKMATNHVCVPTLSQCPTSLHWWNFRELDNVLQCLSLNGCSVFSPMDGILAPCDRKDQRIKLLREGIERDAADICARLFCYVTSGPERVLKFRRVQCTCSTFQGGARNKG